MKNIEYQDWADYIIDILKDLEVECKNVLELGAGQCTISKYLKKNFQKYFVADISSQMLLQCRSRRFKKVCCDMISLPFNCKFDLIFSVFDSVNYLTEPSQLNLFFKETASVLNPEGVLTFDVSLEKNSIANTAELNREGKFRGIRYKQISEYNEVEKIHTNKFLITLDTEEEILEIHKQRIYELEDYFNFIEKNGLYVIRCYEAFTFRDACRNSERVQFVVKKIKR